VAADVRPVNRLERPFLHAHKLSFAHPADGRRMAFESPLPADLQSVLDDVRAAQAPK
jgi:23S rRNA pseudouridine1911/1915/1917 synthase